MEIVRLKSFEVIQASKEKQDRKTDVRREDKEYL